MGASSSKGKPAGSVKAAAAVKVCAAASKPAADERGAACAAVAPDTLSLAAMETDLSTGVKPPSSGNAPPSGGEPPMRGPALGTEEKGTVQRNRAAHSFALLLQGGRSDAPHPRVGGVAPAAGPAVDIAKEAETIQATTVAAAAATTTSAPVSPSSRGMDALRRTTFALKHRATGIAAFSGKSPKAAQAVEPERVFVRRQRTSVEETGVVAVTETDSGSKRINGYEICQLLGSGVYGKVKLCKREGKDYAMKIMSKSLLKKRKTSRNSTALDDVFREIAVMKKLRHKNVVTLHEVIDDPTNSKLCAHMRLPRPAVLHAHPARAATH